MIDVELGGSVLWLPIPLYMYSEPFRVEEIGVK